MILTHSIKVMGRDLQVKSASTTEHVAQVEALVNEKLAEAGAAVSGGDSQIISILAMMNLAEAVLAANSEIENQRSTCKSRVAGLIEKLEKAL